MTSPLARLPGLGPKRLALLARLGISSLEDLLHYYPRDYEDRRTILPVSRLEEGVSVCVRGMISQPPAVSRLPGGRVMARCRAVDSSGTLFLTFFNQPYLKLEQGRDYIFFGKAERYGARWQMVNPAVEPAEAPQTAGRLLPVYRVCAGLNQRQLRQWVRAALDLCRDAIPDDLPPQLTAQRRLCPLGQALEWIHFPQEPEQIAQARRRLIFEEFFLFSCATQRLGRKNRGLPGPKLTYRDPEDFFSPLTFSPTQAQRKAVAQAFADMTSGRRMNRLLQGDVGAGKTLVATACAWLAVENGWQAVIMAPTELLARQHQATLAKLLQPFSIPSELLVSGLPAGEKRRVTDLAASGLPMVLCGTHALIQSGVSLPRAALVVADEQHRFGVAQRAALGQKSGGHLLAMSATPIPRTLTLILYGDLDLSILDELPPGRQPVRTFAITEEKRAGLYGFLQREVDAGGQAYIVCPLVEEGDAPDGRKAASAYLDQLKKALPRLRVGLMHGRLKPEEKERVMAAFAAGETDVLVSTTVIEVGVDVPRATLMIVENADLFGLSQLHQLRGRVGRGKRQSYCFLLHQAKSDTARARLQTLCSTNDGFAIAETDLRLRGPGDFFGRRQSGLPAFSIGNLSGDSRLLEEAQASAKALLEQDPALSQFPRLARRVEEALQQSLAASMN